MRRRALAAAALALSLASAACSSGDDKNDDANDDAATSTTTTTAGTSSTAASTPTPPAPAPAVKGVKLTQMVALDRPTAMALRPGDSAAVYIAEKTGKVRRLVDFRPTGAPVIDVSGNLSLGSEQGLLGLAFSPDGSRAYINYTDAKGDTHIAAHDMNDGPTQLTDLLFVDQPFANHNGGQLAFGADGLLYAGLGDGGSQNDPNNNAQNPQSRLGKILRFDVTQRPQPEPEMFALGLRNPWRFSFDRANGDLWIADVGAAKYEEIDVDRAPLDIGRNYGWPQREGAHRNKSGSVANPVDPEYEYTHDGGNCSVTGGYVYRGAALKSLLEGVYVFADYCAGDLMGLRDGKATDLDVRVDGPSSFGEDAAGELYVLSLRGPVYRLEAK